MDVHTISIRLPAEMVELVRREVARGVYASDSDLIEDALRLWRERGDRLREIKASLEEAAADPAPIPADEVRAHFESRFAVLQAKRG